MGAEKRLNRKGFGLRAEVKKELGSIYASRLVEHLRESDYTLEVDGVVVRLAREFGFCYGVDRAVEYAYESRRRFPDRTLYLTGEIIHNPHVNDRLRGMDVRFLTGAGAVAGGYSAVTEDDVVIIPAFGLPVADLDRLFRTGCTLVDTTCGSVLNVWKNVERYGRDRFTSIIHGKYDHEETEATASRAVQAGGAFLVLRDLAEAEEVAAFLETGEGAEELGRRFAHAASPRFEPTRDLERIGVANQTTMLSSETLTIQERLRSAMMERWGEAELQQRFRAFDTICSATQDRQDAVLALCEEGIDLMLVIGGFNSSNTGHLLEIASQYAPAYHIEDAGGLVARDRLLHLPHGGQPQERAELWLPEGPLKVGVTAGASTPDNRVGEVIERLLGLRGVDVGSLELIESKPRPLAPGELPVLPSQISG